MLQVEAVRTEVVELSAELSVVSSVLVSHLPHAVVVVQQADVQLLVEVQQLVSAAAPASVNR